MARKVFTIGYERASLAQLVAALQAAKVKMLIDVRELPNSRRAGFSKRILAATLGEAGIGYTHLKALGTPKAGREANKARRWDEFWEIVDGALARPEALMALEQAAEIAGEQTACLLCLEHDHAICHRSRVADALAARGFYREPPRTGLIRRSRAALFVFKHCQRLQSCREALPVWRGAERNAHRWRGAQTLRRTNQRRR